MHNLIERVRAADEIPDGISVRVDKDKDAASNLWIDVRYYSEARAAWADVQRGDPIDGEVTIARRMSRVQPCSQAWEVVSSWVTPVREGWGRILYETAIEIATAAGAGLMADRSILSSDAYATWQRLAADPRTKRHQLDDEKSTLTPPHDDDCYQSIARKRRGAGWASDVTAAYYTRALTTIPALKAAGKFKKATFLRGISEGMPLGEADPRRDAGARAVALKRYTHLIRWLRKQTQGPGLRTRKTPDGSIGWSWREIFGKDSGPSWLILNPVNSKWNGAIKWGRTGAEMHLYILKTTGSFLGVMDMLAKPDWRDVFVHEFIHWHDKARGVQGDWNTMGVRTSKGDAPYYLDPHEFNAYFQQGATTLERNLRSISHSPSAPVRAMLKGYLQSAHDFIYKHTDAATSAWPSEFVRFTRADPKRLRAFQKRLVTLYDYLVNKYVRESMAEAASDKPRGVMLHEKSFSTSDIPREFYVVGRLDDNALKDLRQRTLVGVSGISGDPRIVRMFLGSQGRGFVAVMPGRATVGVNKLSRVMYDNPYYLAQNDLAVAKRLSGYSRDPQASQSIASRLGEVMWGHEGMPYESNMVLTYLRLWSNKPIKDLHDLAERWRKVYAEHKPTSPDYIEMSQRPHTWWLRWAEHKMKTRYQAFTREGEWVVKDARLRLPDTAHLLVADFGSGPAQVEKLLSYGVWSPHNVTVASEAEIKAQFAGINPHKGKAR